MRPWSVLAPDFSQTMNNIVTWIIIAVISIAFGILETTAVHNPKGQIFRLMEIWRHSVGYFIAFAIGRFFVMVRWSHISSDGIFSLSDFILSAVFLVSITGWLGYFIKNMTEGVNAIISRILNK